jgi:hypothetical protein
MSKYSYVINANNSKGSCYVYLLDNGGTRFIKILFEERINLSTGSESLWFFQEQPQHPSNGYKQWDPVSYTYDLVAFGGPNGHSAPDKIGIITIVNPNDHSTECTLTPAGTKLFSSTGVF